MPDGRRNSMTVKEQLIEMMRNEGYDFFTAAEHATKALEEFRASDKEEVTLTCGASSVTIRKAKANPQEWW